MAPAEPHTPLTQRRDVYFVAVAISPLVGELGRISCATVGEPDWRRANTRSLDASLDATDRTQRSPRASPLPARRSDTLARAQDPSNI